jgi:hypothetical protein
MSEADRRYYRGVKAHYASLPSDKRAAYVESRASIDAAVRQRLAALRPAQLST